MEISDNCYLKGTIEGYKRKKVGFVYMKIHHKNTPQQPDLVGTIELIDIGRFDIALWIYERKIS